MFVLAGLLVPVAMLPAQPCAAAATAYGQEFARVGRVWSDARPPPLGAASNVASGPHELEYQQQVAEREITGGPYADALAEPLAALALAYRNAGELEEAERLYRRALHIVRVNDGLYSERQVPILRELLDTYRISGDMQTLDERYEYFFRLYGKGQPPYTDIRLRAALEYLRWQREALRLKLGGEDPRRLMGLYELNAELLQAVAQDLEADPILYRNLALGQLRNLYLIQDAIKSDAEKTGSLQTKPILASEWTEKDIGQYRLETIQRGALHRGTSLLENLIVRAGDAPVEQRARLQLELADWYQWNNKERLAGEGYSEVIRLLVESGNEATLQEWLDQPVELPDNGAFWQPQVLQDGQRRIVIQASYDVSERGRANNIETRAPTEEDSSIARRLKRKLSGIRFRPRYRDGQAQPATRLARDYELID